MPKRPLWTGRALLAFVAAVAFALESWAQAPATQPAMARGLAVANKPWTGDFDLMLKRRMIRVYAPFSRSLYFNDKGRERGLAVELVRDWERYLNAKYVKELGKRPLTIYVAPATRDKLLSYVEKGLADIAIGNLTITEERLEAVDFVSGAYGGKTVDEVIVTGPKSPGLASLDDLSGKRVHVRPSSSYFAKAQGYQESQLDQGARSAVGAIGVMQLMPATGREMKVGDIRVTQSNIHAGATWTSS